MSDDLVTVTDKVKLVDDRVGIVKFVGQLDGKRGVWIGIELQKGRGKNSGNNIFPCKKNKGVFVKKNAIARIKPMDNSMPRITYNTRVNIPDKGTGVVRYVGYPVFKQQKKIFFGIHLDEANGKGDGKIKGQFYFRGTANQATFLPVERVVGCEVNDDEEVKEATQDEPEPEASNDDDTSAVAATEEATESNSADESKDSDEYAEGDCVLVDKDKKGQLKFVGENKDTKKLGPGTWYGVRLQEPRGDCNGTYKGVKYFRCPDKFGVMVPGRRIKRRLNDDEIDFDFSADVEPTQEEREAAERLEEAQNRKREMAAVKAKFKEMDTDGNLVLDLTEFQKVMGDTMSSADAEKVFYEIDVSQSGEISFAEFDGWLRAQDGGDTSAAADSDAAAAARAEIAEDVQETVEEMQEADAAEAEAEAAANDDDDDNDDNDDDAPMDDVNDDDDIAADDDDDNDDDAPAGNGPAVDDASDDD